MKSANCCGGTPNARNTVSFCAMLVEPVMKITAPEPTEFGAVEQ